MKIDAKRVMGDPWQLLNLGDFVLIGCYAILALLIVQVMGLGLHRFTLWRVTGVPQPVPVEAPSTPVYSTEAN